MLLLDDPYVQQTTGYNGAREVYSPNQVGQQQQVPYSAHSTPAPALGQQVYQLPTNRQ